MTILNVTTKLYIISTYGVKFMILLRLGGKLHEIGSRGREALNTYSCCTKLMQTSKKIGSDN